MISNKIVFNTWSGAYFHPGGGEVQLDQTKRALEKQGYQVELFNQWNPQVDACLFHQFSTQLGVKFVIDGYRERNAKIAVSPILWAEFDRGGFYYEMLHQLLSSADILFTNSDAESSKIAKNFDLSLNVFHKTRNAISEDFFSLGDEGIFREKFGIEGDFILTIGNIDRRKNTELLVSACQELNLPLVVLGAVRDQEYFSQFSDVYSKASFLGAIFDKKMIKSALRACSVFALPSLCETPGIAALEAASQGAKVVVTQEGAAPEYLNGHAWFVDPRSLEDLVAKLRMAMSGVAQANQISYIKENYTWGMAAQDVISGYRRVLAD